MAVKYVCPTCDRRYVDWGAEKLGYKCPVCPDSELVKLGGADDATKAPPSLKRKAKPPTPIDTEEALVGAVDKSDEVAEVVIGDEDLDDIDAGDGDVVIDDDPLD